MGIENYNLHWSLRVATTWREGVWVVLAICSGGRVVAIFEGIGGDRTAVCSSGGDGGSGSSLQ